MATIAALMITGAAAWAEDAVDRPNGLMWNRTGLPAVFPLLVKTDPGRDYVIVLQEVSDGSHDLAAYARGGETLRVLVPPGTFMVIVQYGEVWQGDDQGFGFGSDAGVMTLPDPLTFRVQGLSQKNGHMIDLRGMIGAENPEVIVEARALCQARSTYRESRIDPLDRSEFDRIWEGRRYTILPDQNTVPTIPPTDFPRLGPREILDRSGRELAYLRFRNQSPPFGIPPTPTTRRTVTHTRSTFCW